MDKDLLQASTTTMLSWIENQRGIYNLPPFSTHPDVSPCKVANLFSSLKQFR
jgi:hypothetical protein